MNEEVCLKHGKNDTFKKQNLNITTHFNAILNKLNTRNYPDLIKGVRETSNKDHIPEPLMKGILRAEQKIYVNKDGTTRYDMTQLPITAFKPKEIGTDLKKLKELGYTKDIKATNLKTKNKFLN